jgi:hypothetical protein
MATHAIRYREKARELYEAADSATDDDFTSLARQYEQLASWMEGVGQYEAAID